MNISQTMCAQRNIRIVLFGAIIALVLSTLAPVRSTTAQQARRTFESKLFAHIPLKVRVKKDKEATALDPSNKNWFRNIEIEVTNTSKKPIYYVGLNVETDVTDQDGLPMMFTLRYGRSDFVSVKTRQPSDVPINPNATQVLTFPTHIVSSLDENKKHEWEAWRDKYKKDDPMKLEVYIEGLVFGDGTAMRTKRVITTSN